MKIENLFWICHVISSHRNKATPRRVSLLPEVSSVGYLVLCSEEKFKKGANLVANMLKDSFGG